MILCMLVSLTELSAVVAGARVEDTILLWRCAVSIQQLSWNQWKSEALDSLSLWLLGLLEPVFRGP